MSALSRRWDDFACWAEAMPWTKIQLFLAAAVYALNTLALWSAYGTASLVMAVTDATIKIDLAAFTEVYQWATIWGGISALQFVGKRASTKPAVVAAEGKVEAEKIVAVAKAENVRKSGAFRFTTHDSMAGPVVPDVSDRPVVTDHDRGVV